MRQRSAISILVLGIVLASGCARKPNDSAVVNRIETEISADTQLKDAILQVTSDKGIVTLSGTVASDAARLDAYKIAAQTPGVAKVVDQMSVQPAAPAAHPNAGTETTSTKAPERKPEPRRSSVNKEKELETDAKTEPADTAPAIPEPTTPPTADHDVPALTSLVPPPTPAVAVAAAPAPAPQPKDVLVPANTTMSVLMIDSVDSAVNRPGEIFHASLDAPIVIGNEVVVPKGADVYVRLASESKAGRLHGKSELTLELVKLEFQGQSYSLESSSYSVSGASQNKDTAKKVGAGAVIGSIIGAVVGGGKGAAIGAAAGAGAGGVYSGTSKSKQVKVPSETRLDFLLDQPVTVTVMPHAVASE